jgi:hypothetical protein
MHGRALAALCLAFLIFGCAGYSSQAARLPLPPKPPSPQFFATPKGESSSTSIPMNAPASLPPGNGPATQVGAGANEQASNDTTAVPSPPPANLIGKISDPVNPGGKPEFDVLHPERAQVYFFYSPFCPYSMRVAPNVSAQAAIYSNSTEWHRINVMNSDGYYFFENMTQEYGIPRSGMVVPMIFVGGYNLVGLQEISDLLPSVLQNATAAG